MISELRWSKDWVRGLARLRGKGWFPRKSIMDENNSGHNQWFRF